MRSRKQRQRRRSLDSFALKEGSPVVVYLQGPKEKAWGLLLSLTGAGVVLRGLDLEVFEDWMRQEARKGEPDLAPSTLFYPMSRVERIERDETIGPVPGLAERFELAVGRTVRAAFGLTED